jgi:hypothetical protein
MSASPFLLNTRYFKYIFVQADRPALHLSQRKVLNVCENPFVIHLLSGIRLAVNNPRRKRLLDQS